MITAGVVSPRRRRARSQSAFGAQPVAQALAEDLVVFEQQQSHGSRGRSGPGATVAAPARLATSGTLQAAGV